jgi:hypothetical protein
VAVAATFALDEVVAAATLSDSPHPRGKIVFLN